MSVAAFIGALRKAGVPAEQILDAVEVMEQERLAKGRARTAKSRNMKRNGDVTHVTHVTHVTAEGHNKETRATHGDARVEDNLLPLETSGKKEGNKKERARAARIPPDFHPSIDDALAEGLSRQTAEREARKFVDHFLGAPGERGLKQNWPATWRNWCRRVGDGPYQSQGPPANGHHPRKLSTAEQALHELDKYRDPPKQSSFESEAAFGTGETLETSDFRRIG